MRQLKIGRQITYRNENSINQYFKEISKYPMVSIEEEVELSLRIHKGDEMAMQKLIEANLRFVVSVAKQYQNQGLSFADLINEGNVGLVKAAGKFDETRGFKFISYAVWWIRQSIIQAISEQTRVVRLPLNRLTSMNKISKASPFLEQQFEREPTNSELAEFLEMNEEIIAENAKIKNHQLSFDKPISFSDESGFCLYDIIEAENVPKPDENLLHESVKIDIQRALKKLSDRETHIISMSYGIGDSQVYSLNEIAEMYNMSRERIRQIRSAGLSKIKKILAGKTCFHNNV